MQAVYRKRLMSVRTADIPVSDITWVEATTHKGAASLWGRVQCYV